MKDLKNEIKILLNLFNAGKFETVIIKSKKLIRKFPEYVILYNILGSAYQNCNNLNFAKNVFIKGYKMDPGNIAIMNNLANIYKNTSEIELSESLFNKIIKKKPSYINAYINLGNLKRDSNNFGAAIELYIKALNINDKIPVISYSLALAYQGLGNFDLAIKFAKKTLLLDAKFTQADMLISQSAKYKDENKHYIEMNSKIKNLDLNDNQKINLLFALAKADEDLGKIDRSFKNFEMANQIKRRALKFDINNLTGNNDDGDEDNETSEDNTSGLPNPADIQSHISDMLEGKIGQLASEIAEETSVELDLSGNEQNMDGIMKDLLKDPTKIMGLIKKVGTKLNDKIKSGELSESDLISEAGDILKKMKGMPGMGNMSKILSKMGMGDMGGMGGMGGKGGKVNVAAMQNKIQENLKRAQTKERMQKKLQERQMEKIAKEAMEKARNDVNLQMQTDQHLDNLLKHLEEEEVREKAKAEKAAKQPQPKNKNGKKKKNKNKK